MLDRPSRVTKDEIGTILKQGRTYHSPKVSFRVFYKPNTSTAFGVVVSKKVAVQAVVRNKIKRRVKSILRKNLAQTKSGYKSLFFIKKEGVEARFKDLEADIVYLLEAARILKK
ncbi:MAG: ribonuclease P protein component [Candidatus Vogelbacteria bacterium RIFOXYD1_FULL_46_19]|uniref:Ribonuclease P protein component n=1 Tax=Candidatus Vogelbacteria bacterium RIFOXYD1_FULL_46_19 TaxID=1802439 RepID=A0A1G2QID5_9BACT|nr:MAG: ribonuclease P protein component [Candidatus Vogelbacteria bacterium RIFOXYD1_FULL_46_19]